MTAVFPEHSSLFPESCDAVYTIRTESFEGPLDLLLHLIKKNEVSIHDIPISLITKQYLETIELMQELNLDVAGEFLVMAATLIHIKSKMLVPVEPTEAAGEEEAEDPREVLVQRLLEMGLLEGDEIEVVGFAPLGDPMEVRLRDYRLSLRRSEAAHIAVTLMV